jgi:hypothetical protein
MLGDRLTAEGITRSRLSRAESSTRVPISLVGSK